MSAIPNSLFIRCPYCGSEYEVGRDEFGRKARCEICGKSFIIGQTATRQSEPPNSNLYCTACGNRITPNAAFCTKCGRPITRLRQATRSNAIPDTQVFSRSQGADAIRKPNMAGAVVVTALVTLCCCLPLPLGIAAIVFAAQANSKLSTGDLVGARKAIDTSDTLIKVCIGLIMLGIVLHIIRIVGVGIMLNN